MCRHQHKSRSRSHPAVRSPRCPRSGRSISDWRAPRTGPCSPVSIRPCRPICRGTPPRCHGACRSAIVPRRWRPKATCRHRSPRSHSATSPNTHPDPSVLCIFHGHVPCHRATHHNMCHHRRNRTARRRSPPAHWAHCPPPSYYSPPSYCCRHCCCCCCWHCSSSWLTMSSSSSCWMSLKLKIVFCDRLRVRVCV